MSATARARLALTLLAVAGPAVSVAQGPTPPKGRPYLFTLDLAGTPLDEVPDAVKVLNGVMTVVDKDGQHMLKASSPSEFLITLPQALPADFTIEVEFIPKVGGGAPDDLMLEGTPTRNRGVASAELTWHTARISAVGGSPDMYQSELPADLAASTPGTLTHVVVVVSGPTIKLYTNGRRLYTLEKQFVRGRVVRVWLGGADEGPNAVYLAGFRIGTGAVAPGVVAAQTGPPSQPQPSAPPPDQRVLNPQPQAPPPRQPEQPAPAPPQVAPPPGAAVPPTERTPAPGDTRIAALAPPAPTGLVASGSLPAITLQWQLARGATTYRVFRALPGTTDWVELSTEPITPPAELAAGATFAPPSFLVGTDDRVWTYRVVAYQPDGRSGEATVDYAASMQLSQGTPLPRERTRPTALDSTASNPVPIQVGTGISDITGPMAEVGLLGYGKTDQLSAGLHTRLYARAFVFADQSGGRRVAFVSAELGMMYSSVKDSVLKSLAAKYGDRYNRSNVMLSATHTHAGPGGFSHHIIYNLGTLGFIAQNFATIVTGITEAIARADSTVAPATVSVMSGEVAAVTVVNRSLKAFRLNPEAQTASPINRAMTVLKIERNGRPVGVIAWHAVHNTSMTGQNHLISSDHKGYAAYLFEKQYGSIAPLRNYGGFVAAFPNGAEGDMSPNVAGSDPVTYTPPCEGAPSCGLHGPGVNEFESASIIGQREFDVAHSLFQLRGQTPVGGLIDSRHSFVFMPAYVVANTQFTNGMGTKTLCPAGYGASFMAGAEDGPSGPLPEGLALGTTMTQAMLEEARLDVVKLVGLLMPPLAPLVADLMLRSADSDRCQFPKPVLVPTGHLPNWTPETLPFQLLRIGPLAIAGIPGEMTIQAGRRLEEQLRSALLPLGVQQVILTGLANEYSGYITTPEEYASQQYEGASTLYGRLTFDAYREIFTDLATAMAANQPARSGPPPADLSLIRQIELQTPVILDGTPPGETFGQVLTHADTTARGGVAITIYRSGHPKNDLRRNNSYIRIERDVGSEPWQLVAWDGMPETKLFWGRPPNCPIGCTWSSIGVQWTVPMDATPGRYRIRFVGSWKNQSGQLIRYQGADTLVIK